MFATKRSDRRQLAVIETLDSRQLLSATVPDGYVQVGHLSLDSYTLAPQTFSVTGGSDYFFVATGKHVLAQSPTRYADAGGYQPNATTWTSGTHLHVRSGSSDLVNWGSHEADNEYGASYTAPNDATLTAVITDSNRFDNSGSLDLYIYQRQDALRMASTREGSGTEDTLAAATDPMESKRDSVRSVFGTDSDILGDADSSAEDILTA